MMAWGNHYRAVNRKVHCLFVLWILLSLSLFVPGCGPKTFADIELGIQSRGHYVEDVPFYRQTSYACGPAALASVFAYWKHPVDLDQLTRSIVLVDLQGTLPMDMERAAKDAGLRTTTAHGDRALLLASIKRNVPVICLLDLGFGPLQQPHYVTIVGYDDGNLLFIMHDGSEPNRTISYDRFETVWGRAGKWMLLVEPQ
jgi:ABC-type bacteriocin/lantibiotic exporter with double-glycine peptidase domain